MSTPSQLERRDAGFTIMEMAVSIGILTLTLGVVSASFNALTSGITTLDDAQIAHAEAAKLRVGLTNDFQLADATGVDESGAPYFVIQQKVDPADSVVFRKIEGYDTAGGGFTPILSSPIEYRLDVGNHLLVREKDGNVTTLGRRVRRVTFAVTPKGLIKVTVTTFGDWDDNKEDAVNHFRFAPRNRNGFTG